MVTLVRARRDPHPISGRKVTPSLASSSPGASTPFSMRIVSPRTASARSTTPARTRPAACSRSRAAARRRSSGPRDARLPTSASVSSSQSSSSCSLRSIGVSVGQTPRSCTARSMPRLYGRLRDAHRERPPAVYPAFVALKVRRPFLRGLMLERDLARLPFVLALLRALMPAPETFTAHRPPWFSTGSAPSPSDLSTACGAPSG